MRTCTKCGLEKPYSQFGKTDRVKSGIRSRCKPCESKRGSERYRRIKDKMLKHNAEYRKQNHERRLEIERRSRLKNKEKNRPAKNARQSVRNRKLNSEEYVILPRELDRIYNSPCLVCGSMENQSLDHVIPLSRGGRHSVGNIITLCLSCNVSKHARTLTEWKLSKRKIGVD